MRQPILQAQCFDKLSPAQHDEMTADLANVIFATNLAHSWVEHPAVKAFFARWKPAFTLPSRYTISGRLLDAAYNATLERVHRFLQSSPYLTLTSDGWSLTMGSDKIANLQLCGHGDEGAFSVYHGMVAAGTESQSAAYIASALTAEIETNGLQDRVVAVMTDTCSTMKAAWGIIETKFPRILGLGCFLHRFDLYLKDVAKLPTVALFFTDVKEVVNYFKSHSRANQMLIKKRQECRATGGRNVALESFSNKRFCSVGRVLAHLSANHVALQKLVVEPDFSALKGKAADIKNLVLNSQFWHDATMLSRLYEPFVAAMHNLESDASTLYDVYWAIRELNVAHHNFYAAENAAKPEGLAGTSFYADLRSARDDWDTRVKQAWHPALSLAAALHPLAHTRPELLPQEKAEAKDLCLKLADDGRDPKKVSAYKACDDLATFMRRGGSGGGPAQLGFSERALSPLNRVAATSPALWWKEEGYILTQLQDVAQRIFAIPASAAAGERNWSAWKFIWGDRACMLPKRVGKLVFIYFNTRVMGRAVADQVTWEEFLRDFVTEEEAADAAAIADPDLDAGAASEDATTDIRGLPPGGGHAGRGGDGGSAVAATGSGAIASALAASQPSMSFH